MHETSRTTQRQRPSEISFAYHDPCAPALVQTPVSGTPNRVFKPPSQAITAGGWSRNLRSKMRGGSRFWFAVDSEVNPRLYKA
jgi:hypothetical protein